MCLLACIAVCSATFGKFGGGGGSGGGWSSGGGSKGRKKVNVLLVSKKTIDKILMYAENAVKHLSTTV